MLITEIRMGLKIIVRHAQSDLEALHTAQGMENADASVFSITHDGIHQRYGAMIPSSKFVVWAKYDESITSPDQIDEAIDKEFLPMTVAPAIKDL
jgi:hypothetical protein